MPATVLQPANHIPRAGHSTAAGISHSPCRPQYCSRHGVFCSFAGGVLCPTNHNPICRTDSTDGKLSFDMTSTKRGRHMTLLFCRPPFVAGTCNITLCRPQFADGKTQLRRCRSRFVDGKPKNFLSAAIAGRRNKFSFAGSKSCPARRGVRMHVACLARLLWRLALGLPAPALCALMPDSEDEEQMDGDRSRWMVMWQCRTVSTRH